MVRFNAWIRVASFLQNRKYGKITEIEYKAENTESGGKQHFVRVKKIKIIVFGIF